ncbi:uncharacterized protein PV06_06105 [Exophiala oligosperma]|uniref:Rhodopsin domain-containing protein n=1 Tax=Exophiala oligosperma TaxID=215243 RepID=A0A0D2ARR9_9EURO|nr:uncharacterized protein PV06_06105 [Exophiala oligosperma]KIW42566.1 hypothetical protein PV06_06105 [Exophiala oligosperma]
MSSPARAAIPPGQSAPFASVTPDDHAAYVLISTAFGLACFLFFGGIRTVVRVTLGNGIGFDDHLFYAATGFAIIQSSLVLGACSKGLGKSLSLVSPEAVPGVQKMYYASNLFFILVIGLCKISVVSFLHRISRMKQHRFIFDIAMVILAIWTFGAFLTIALQCNLSHPWLTVNEKCPGVLERWQVIGALDIVTEVAIVALVGYLVHDLQTRLSSKATVMSIFSVRLFLIVFIAFRLHTFDQDAYTTNPFLREATFIAWTQSQMTFALISAAVPTFQNFLKSLSTGFGGMGGGGASHGYGYGSSTSRSRHRLQDHHSHSKSFQLSTLRSKSKSVVLASSMDDDGQEECSSDRHHAKVLLAEQLRGGAPAAAAATTTTSTTTAQWSVSRGPINGETTSINSDESQRYMIRKDVQWEVRTEPRD